MDIEIRKVLDECELRINDLETRLVKRVVPSEISLTAKVPFKVYDTREGLLYRAVDLAKSSSLLLASDNIVSSACTTRALQETVAVLFYINRKVKKTLKSNDIEHLDKTLMSILLGSKIKTKLPNPVNILTIIEHVNKEVSNYRELYDELSEYSHPNWAGTLAIYSKINSKEIWTDYGRNIGVEKSTWKKIVHALNASLFLLLHTYDQFPDLMTQLIEICEKEVVNSKQ